MSVCHAVRFAYGERVYFDVNRQRSLKYNLGSIPEREPEKRLPHLRKAAGAQITQS